MIGVLADDLSGATEIAGIGWRFGLKSQVILRGTPAPGSDLVVYDTDSRLCGAREAVRRVSRFAAEMNRLNPRWVYKKVDSLLRGHVLDEIQTICTRLGLDRCLLVPANPAAGRTIRDGRYFVKGVPISQTSFRRDPAYPRRSCFVSRLLDPNGSRKVTLLQRGELHAGGVGVGEAETVSDLQHWSKGLTPGVLPAGGAEFFRAMLENIGLSEASHRAPPLHASRTLFVCGSVSAPALQFVKRCRAQKWPVFLIPPGLATPGSRETAQWVQDICDALTRHNRALVTIGLPLRHGKEAEQVGALLVWAAQRVITRSKPDRVCVDGGATAALLLRQSGASRLKIDCDFAMGVTGIRPVGSPDLQIVVKPGSYAWPESLFG